jgi:hypothetical protein
MLSTFGFTHWLFPFKSPALFTRLASLPPDVGGVFVSLGSTPGSNDIAGPVFVEGLEQSHRAFDGLHLAHGSVVHTTVQAQNRASPPGKTSALRLSGVSVDLTPPVAAVLPPLDPAVAGGDGWLLRTARADTLDLLARGARSALGFNASAWAAAGNVTLAAGAFAPYWDSGWASSRSDGGSAALAPFYDAAWPYERGMPQLATPDDPAVDPFPYLTTFAASPAMRHHAAWVHGNEGPLLTLLLRFAVADPESFVANCSVSAGSSPGTSDLA